MYTLNSSCFLFVGLHFYVYMHTAAGVPSSQVLVRPKKRQHCRSDNQHYSAHCRYTSFPSVPRGFTRTMYCGNRHYSTGTTEGTPYSCTVRTCLSCVVCVARLVAGGVPSRRDELCPCSSSMYAVLGGGCVSCG